MLSKFTSLFDSPVNWISYGKKQFHVLVQVGKE